MNLIINLECLQKIHSFIQIVELPKHQICSLSGTLTRNGHFPIGFLFYVST